MTGGTKNKIAFLAIGLVAGVSLGVVFGYAIKEGLSRLNFLHSSLKEIDSRQSQISVRLDSIESKISKRESGVKHYGEPGQTKTAGTGSKRTKDTSQSASSAGENATPHLAADDSNVVVMTDEMVAARSVSLTSLDSSEQNPAARSSDSVIGVLNDETPRKAGTQYQIEFWESPINLKGYKMTAGKLILFGINSIAPVKLIKWKGTIYIVTGQDVFRTEFTDDFRPYEKMTDKNLIKKLKG